MRLPLKISDLSDDVFTIIEDADGILLFQSLGDKLLEEAQTIVKLVNHYEILEILESVPLGVSVPSEAVGLSPDCCFAPVAVSCDCSSCRAVEYGGS